MATRSTHASIRRSLFLAASAAAFALTACGSVNTTSTRESGPTPSTIPSFEQINDLFTDIFLHVRDVREGRTPSGLRTAQVDVANDGFSTRHFAYKFVWSDASGMNIESQTSTWQNAAVASGTRITISSVAPNSSAANFSLQVRSND